MRVLCTLLLPLLLLSGCSRQGAVYQQDPFLLPTEPDTAQADLEGALTNIQQTAQVLEELGIVGAADAGAEMQAELRESEYSEYLLPYYTTMEDVTVMLLGSIGAGEWDEETWEYRPVSAQVYWFDFEAFNLDTMYTEVVRGIDAITGEDAVFADITEDTSQVDYEMDTGTQGIGFLCNGEPCRYEAPFSGDWIDPDFLTFMGEVLEGSASGRRLYLCSDMGQGCILLWQTPEWAGQLREATGLALTPAAQGLYSGPDDLLSALLGLQAAWK